jgi:hypothetical protein
MSRTSPRDSPTKKTTLGSIFISVITVGGIALSGLVDSPAKGVALILTGLAVAAVANRVLKIWSGRLDTWLVVLLVVFLFPFGWLVALLLPDLGGNGGASTGRTVQLQNRIEELERENAALKAGGSTSTSSTFPPDDRTTTTVQPASTSKPSAGAQFDLDLRYGWGADLDTGEKVRPQDAEGSDIYNDGWITGRYNELVAFSHKPSREECKTAIQDGRGEDYYRFSDVTEGTSFCLLTDKERIAVLRVARLGHDAESDTEYVVFSVSVLK